MVMVMNINFCRLNNQQKLMFIDIIAMEVSLGQRIGWLPRELQQEIVGLVDTVSLIIVRKVLLGVDFPQFINGHASVFQNGLKFFLWCKENLEKHIVLGRRSFYYYAAKLGDCDIVNWLIINNRKSDIDYGLATAGRFEQLKAAVDAGFILGFSICTYAAKSGRLDMLKWLNEQGFHMDEWTCAAAAKRGFIDILKWARFGTDTECPWNSWTCNNAALGGHLEILKWARKKGCDWSTLTCSYASRGGHLDVLKWLRAKGCSWDEAVCSTAAREGRLDILEWARAHQCPWDEWTCVGAAQGGHLDVLKWCRSHGCPWNSDVCFWAAMNGHLDMLQWAYEHGCILDVDTIEMKKFEHPGVCQWIINHSSNR
jgi:hypothetical protein